MSAKPVLRYVRPWIKAAWFDQQRTVGVRLAAAGPGKLQPEVKIPLSSTPTRYDLPAYRAWPNGQEFTDDDLANFELRYRDIAAVPGDLRVHATGITFSYNQPPGVTLDPVPTPLTVGSWRPTWQFVDPEGDPQESYELRVYQQPLGGWPDFVDPDDEIVALDTAGTVAYFVESELTDAQFASIILLPPTGTLRLYVRAADVGSGQRYSSWSRVEFAMAVVAPPPAPDVTVAARPEAVSVDVTIAPYAGANVDFVQIERSDDAGITWTPLPGTTPDVAYVPASANRVNNSGMTADTNGDNVADGWELYSTPDTDPQPTPGRVFIAPTGNAQLVNWTTNTGYKGVRTQPRVAEDGSNVWPANTVWSISFDWKVSAANSSLLPVLPFPTDLFTVTWMSRPAVSTTDFVNYSALVEVGVSDVETDLYIVCAPTVTGGWIEVTHVMVAPGGRVLHAGYGSEAYGAMGYGGWTAETDETDPSVVPYSLREATTVDLVDRFAPREIPVRYRARVGAYSGSGAAWRSIVALSEWGVASPVTLASDGNDWLQSSTDATFDVPLKLAGPSLQSASDVKQTILWPEGREDPVVNTGAVRFPTFAALAIACRNETERAAVEALRRKSRTEPLLLRTCFGEASGVGLEQRWIKLGALVDTRWGGYPEQRGAQVHDIVVAAQTVAGPT